MKSSESVVVWKHSTSLNVEDVVHCSVQQPITNVVLSGLQALPKVFTRLLVMNVLRK